MSAASLVRVVLVPDRRLEALETLAQELRTDPHVVPTVANIAQRWALEPATAADVLAVLLDAGVLPHEADTCGCSSCRQAC